MPDETFKKLLGEIAPYKTPIRFIRWGEPLLHPKLVEYIAEAKNRGSIVHLNTNGSRLTETIMEEMVAIPLDSIKFSFQGADRKSYTEMRNTDFFDKLLENVQLLYEKRGERDKPYMHISTTITYETAEQVKEFRGKVGRFVDLVTVGRTVLEFIDMSKVRLSETELRMLEKLKGEESVIKKHLQCPEVFDKLSVNWDGTVSACCHDYDNMMVVGDLATDSLKQIWMSDKMQHYRSMLANMRHDELALCRTCFDYHGLQTPGLQGID